MLRAEMAIDHLVKRQKKVFGFDWFGGYQIFLHPKRAAQVWYKHVLLFNWCRWLNRCFYSCRTVNLNTLPSSDVAVNNRSFTSAPSKANSMDKYKISQLLYCITVIGQLLTLAEIIFVEKLAVPMNSGWVGLRVRLGQQFSVLQ